MEQLQLVTCWVESEGVSTLYLVAPQWQLAAYQTLGVGGGEDGMVRRLTKIKIDLGTPLLLLVLRVGSIAIMHLKNHRFFDQVVFKKNRLQEYLQSSCK